MIDATIIFVGALIGALSFVLGSYYFYREANRQSKALISAIEKADNDLLADIRDIGVAELITTSAGSKILSLLKESGYEIPVSRYQSSPHPKPSKIHEDSEVQFLKDNNQQDLITCVGLVGGDKSKSLLIDHLIKKYNFSYENFQAVAQNTVKNYKVESQEYNDLQEQIARIRKMYGNDIFARIILNSFTKAKDYPIGLLVDGITHPDEVKFLRSNTRFTLIGFSLSNELRFREAANWISEKPDENEDNVYSQSDLVIKVEKEESMIASTDQHIESILKHQNVKVVT